MPIKAECGSCHKRFKAPDKLAGKKVKCPQCGGVIPIPKPQPPKEEEGDLYALADEPKAAAPATVAPQAAPSNCPSCGSALLDNAVLCVLCGFDLRTGQKVETQPAPLHAAAGPQVTLGRTDWQGEAAKEAKQQEKKKKKRRKGGSSDIPQAVLFLRGLAVSFGAALIGSFMWFGLAYSLDIEMAIIAWVLGGLAGVGMMIGYGVEDVLAGLAAAGVALLAIFVAKVMIFAVFLSNPAHFMDLDDEEVQAEIEAAMEEAKAEMEAAMAKMPDQQMPGVEGMAPGEQISEEEWNEAKMAAEEAFDEELPGEDLAEVEMPTGLLIVTALVGGFISMFLPLWNILYLLLACATAYGVGSGGDWFGE